jgi:hypothetical protein
MRSVMMVMMGAGARRVLIRMTPLTVTSKVRMRMAAVWEALIDNVARRRVGLDWFRSGDRGHPGRAAEPPFVLALLFTRVVILSIVGKDEVAVASGEGPGSGGRGVVSAERETNGSLAFGATEGLGMKQLVFRASEGLLTFQDEEFFHRDAREGREGGWVGHEGELLVGDVCN